MHATHKYTSLYLNPCGYTETTGTYWLVSVSYPIIYTQYEVKLNSIVYQYSFSVYKDQFSATLVKVV